MRKAGDFLSRFQKLTPPNDAIRRTVAYALHSVIGAKISTTVISVRNGVAYVEVPSILKSKIRISRKDILDLLYEKLPQAKSSVRDIR